MVAGENVFKRWYTTARVVELCDRGPEHIRAELALLKQGLSVAQAAHVQARSIYELELFMAALADEVVLRRAARLSRVWSHLPRIHRDNYATVELILYPERRQGENDWADQLALAYAEFCEAAAPHFASYVATHPEPE